uniref:DUF1350 domain-containing protein n=1 Tax=Cyanothece sp. (strain PCC 7425 / ATCC 29141) TaxID=395961 RepID=B8HUY0_CYAP4
MNWQEVKENWVLLPTRPLAIIHFLGGAFVAAAPQTTYNRLLEFLAKQGYGIIATPFINTLDHRAIATEVETKFERALASLQQQGRLKRFLPIYGLGHSMGCKLHLLMGSLSDVNRAGNIFLSFNNFSADQAIPLVQSLNLGSTLEFTPTPRETNRLIQQHYQVRRNLLIRFSNDEIDQTLQLQKILEERFPGLISLRQLPGSHLTPLGQDLNWQMGSSFSPLDAVGQWIRQEVFRELAQLEQVILQWLEPATSFR